MSGLMELFAFDSLQSQAALREFLWIALKGTAVLAAAFAAALLLRRSSASLRHLAWAASFAILLALPAWALLLPAWELELGLSKNWHLQAPTNSRQVQENLSGTSVSASLPSSEPAFNAFPAWTAPGSYPASGLSLSGLFNRPDALLALWLLVASALLLRWAAGYAALRRTIARSRQVRDPDWHSLMSRLSARLGLERPVELRFGASRQMPLTWGIRRPGVLLPAEALDWEEGKKEIVLLHELAHVRRRDVLIQHLTALASALYWFNPLVWAASRQLQQEREGACDDLVLRLGTRPSEYARHLLNLARRMRSPGWSPVLAMARRSQLEGRLLAILDPKRIRAGASPQTLIGVTLLVTLMAAPLAALSPAFRTEPELQSASSASQSSRTVERSESTRSSTSREGSRSGSISESNDGRRLEIRMEGVRISTGYSLTGIDPGGYFEITQRGSEGRRRLEIEPASSGGLRQSFFVNGEKSESKAEAEELLQEALQTLRRIDHDRERVHQELESVHEAQAQAREEMERGRLEMQHAMREAERAVAQAQRENRVHMEEARRQLEEALRETKASSEVDMRRLQEELQRSREEMERALQETQQMREREMARMQDEMRHMQEELQAQRERLRDELAQEMRHFQEERERLHDVRQELHDSIRETVLQTLGATDLRNDSQAWSRLRDQAGALASEILSESSSIEVEDRTIRFSSSSSVLSDRIRRFLDRTLPGGLSGLYQELRDQLQDAIDRLSTELSDFTVER
ncbi:MAG: M56 family metallopeptidase [Acidobacteriota bacterium]